MKQPKMILFDYGQTLLDEKVINPLAANQAVLDHADYVPDGVTAQTVRETALSMTQDISACGGFPTLEVHEHMFQRYLYDLLGVRFSIPADEIEWIFGSTHYEVAVPTPYLLELLAQLREAGIRSAVVSNITFSGDFLRRHIEAHIPDHRFEFVLASSDYVFKKPHPRIFQMALRKAGLSAQDVWFCGDNALCDVDGSARMGMQAVWYQGAVKHEQEPPQKEHLYVDDWRQLMDILSTL